MTLIISVGNALDLLQIAKLAVQCVSGCGSGCTIGCGSGCTSRCGSGCLSGCGIFFILNNVFGYLFVLDGSQPKKC